LMTDTLAYIMGIDERERTGPKPATIGKSTKPL